MSFYPTPINDSLATIRAETKNPNRWYVNVESHHSNGSRVNGKYYYNLADLENAIDRIPMRIWYLDDKRHRDDDLSAIDTTDRTFLEWYKHGVHHRDNGPARINDSFQEWYRDGKLHCDNDSPAVIINDGTKKWYKNGLLHRDGDKPAVEKSNGEKEWWVDGKQCRSNGLPTRIYPDGTSEWEDRKSYCAVSNNKPVRILIDGTKIWSNTIDRYHRTHGLPAVIHPDGSCEWYVEGKKHRDNDLPAVVMSNGMKMWFIKGRLHRDNGLPAIIRPNGECEWWDNGDKVTDMKLCYSPQTTNNDCMEIELENNIRIKELENENEIMANELTESRYKVMMYEYYKITIDRYSKELIDKRVFETKLQRKLESDNSEYRNQLKNEYNNSIKQIEVDKNIEYEKKLEHVKKQLEHDYNEKIARYAAQAEREITTQISVRRQALDEVHQVRMMRIYQLEIELRNKLGSSISLSSEFPTSNDSSRQCDTKCTICYIDNWENPHLVLTKVGCRIYCKNCISAWMEQSENDPMTSKPIILGPVRFDN